LFSFGFLGFKGWVARPAPEPKNRENTAINSSWDYIRESAPANAPGHPSQSLMEKEKFLRARFFHSVPRRSRHTNSTGFFDPHSSFTHIRTTMSTATKYSQLAADHAARCTKEENKRRAENGRRTNVAYAFEEEEAEVFFRGSATASDESECQPSRFGSATFANA